MEWKAVRISFWRYRVVVFLSTLADHQKPILSSPTLPIAFRPARRRIGDGRPWGTRSSGEEERSREEEGVGEREP